MRPRDIYSGTASIEIVEDYGGTIKAARESKGMNLDQFAASILEKKGTLAKIESNNLVPDERLTRKIERALDIKLTETVQPGENVGMVRSDKMTLGNFINKD